MNNLLTITDLSKERIEHIFTLSRRYYFPTNQLQWKNIVFAFAKPSLRTKIATEVAISQLWWHVIHIEPEVFYWGKVFSIASEKKLNSWREDLRDTVKNIHEWCDALFARVFSQETLLDIQSYSNLKIVNALSDTHHPMQAIADLYTIQENFWSSKVSLAFVGDSNNVSFSLAEILLKFWHDVRIASPKGYDFSQVRKLHLLEISKQTNGNITFTDNPVDAVRWVDAVYADSFVSMGEESVYNEKMKSFAGYQVNKELLSHANKKCYFMHCLPAHRGVEVTDDIMDGEYSLIYHQARNRMVTARWVFLTLFDI